MKTIRSFDDIVVFQRAYKLSLEIHKVSLKLPRVEQYGLAEQMRRASKSICANLAEGYGKQKHSKAEFKRYILTIYIDEYRFSGRNASLVEILL